MCPTIKQIVICLVITVLSLGCCQFQRTSRRTNSSMIDKYMHQLADEHIKRMNTSCSKPQLQVFYPKTGPSQVLTPRGTYLHRCNGQSGCCPDISHSCQPIEKEPIFLVFYVQTLKVEGKGKTRPVDQVKNMTLFNHTKCGCLPIQKTEILDENKLVNL